MNGRKGGGGQRKRSARLIRNLLAPERKFPTPRPRWKVGGGFRDGAGGAAGAAEDGVVFGRAPRFLEVRGKLQETSKT